MALRPLNSVSHILHIYALTLQLSNWRGEERGIYIEIIIIMGDCLEIREEICDKEIQYNCNVLGIYIVYLAGYNG